MLSRSGSYATLLSVLDQAPPHFASLYRNIVMPVAIPGLVGFDLEDLRYILSRPGLSACTEAESINADNALETYTTGLQRLSACNAPLRSVTSAVVTATACGSPCVSTAIWRLMPATFLPTS